MSSNVPPTSWATDCPRRRPEDVRAARTHWPLPALLGAVVALFGACGPPSPPSSLTDADIERVCALAERCGGGLAMPDCIPYYEDVRDGAAHRGCAELLAAELRCFVDAGACGPTPGCAEAQRAYEACADRSRPDAGEPSRDAARDAS